MFGLTKKNPQNQENNKSDAQRLGQQKDFDLENMPIHTMKEDMENPDAEHGIIMPKNTELRPSQGTLLQKENSPFLNPNQNSLSGLKSAPNKNTLGAEIGFETNTPINTTDYKNTPSMSTDYSAFHFNWRIVFFSTFSLVIILILGWVGFNYSQNKNYTPPEETAKNFETTPEENLTEDPAPKPTLSYSETNPNYLRMEDASLDAEKIKTILRQYMKIVSQEGYKAPVEFVITDVQNKPIGFKAFSSILGLNFSPALLALLGENFTIFINDDAPAPRIGLAIESKDDINLEKVILQEEKTLADEISPILFTNDYKKTMPFESTEYAGAKIRYQNIISPDNLSVDHSVYKNKLIIGTTKATMQALINHFNKVTIK